MRQPDSSTGLSVELLLDSAPSAKIEGVVVATVTGFDEGNAPRISFAGNPLRRPLSARSLIPLMSTDVGIDVAVSFEQGDPSRPMVLGKLWQPNQASTVTVEPAIDGERLVLTAKKEIVLQCGEASITLTRSGKVLIRGAYLSSRSSGVNRINGGSVQIN